MQKSYLKNTIFNVSLFVRNQADFKKGLKNE